MHAADTTGNEVGRPTKLDVGTVLTVVLLTVAAVFYVSLIGLIVIWGRLAAARLPVDSSLPLVDIRVFFLAGLRLAFAMTIVFGLMCLAAYFVFTRRRWKVHAEAWHTRVRGDPKDWNPAEKPHDNGRTDRYIRVIAGFNVGVVSVVVGLVAARLLKTVIDQAWPGRWWSLILPWAVISFVVARVLVSTLPAKLARWAPVSWLVGLLSRLLAWLEEGRTKKVFAGTSAWLRERRTIRLIIGTLIVAAAMVASAPFGLLLLTWGGIASLGQRYGKTRVAVEPGFRFLLSPLPWVLLTIYALIGLAFSTMPPISFPQAAVGTSGGTHVGGFLARTPAGVYLITCTPLATATSTNENVTLFLSGEVKSVTTRNRSFILDSGYRPSLPTLALHAFGLSDESPTWIRPEPRPRRGTCAGAPAPRPSIGLPAPALGTDVFAGPPQGEGPAKGGEPPIEEQRVPRAIVRAARLLQPTLLVTVADRFWPVSVGAVLEDRGGDGSATCLHLHATTARCPLPQEKKTTAGVIPNPSLSDLGNVSSPSDYLEYPASPPLDRNPTGQLEAFLRGQLAWQSPVPRQHEWLADPGLLNPWRTGQIYFYYRGEATPHDWPVVNEKIAGLLTFEYWFFYPYNYYPTLTSTSLMNEAPIAADLANTDLHQGDWEHVDVFVEKKTLRPRWLYTARHSDEGQYFSWDDHQLSFDEGHPVIQAAYGGHPSYPPHCGERLRFAHGLNGMVADWLVCGSGRFAFRASKTPLVDIARTPWACWKGHFGVATARQLKVTVDEDAVQRAIDKYYTVAGPRSPLWQAENGSLNADEPKRPDRGACAQTGGPTREEKRAAVSAVLGRG